MKTVTYDLATLTASEVLRARLRHRYPLTRDPIRNWLWSVLVMSACLAGLGFVAGLASWPRFRPDTMAIASGMAGVIRPVLFLSRLGRSRRMLRDEGLCTTEVNPEGVIRRTATRECKYHWVPGQKFTAPGDDVLIGVGGGEYLWLPRRAFPSAEDLDSFLRSVQHYYADAMSRPRPAAMRASFEL